MDDKDVANIKKRVGQWVLWIIRNKVEAEKKKLLKIYSETEKKQKQEEDKIKRIRERK